MHNMNASLILQLFSGKTQDAICTFDHHQR